MPDGKLGEREYKLFKNWLETQGFRWPFGIGLPENQPGIRESQQYRNYIQSGAAPTAVSQRTAGIMGGILPPEATVAPPTPGEQAEALGVIRDIEKPPVSGAGAGMPVKWETVTEGGWKYSVGYDEGGNVVSRNPLGRAEAEEPGMPEGMWKTHEEALKAAPAGYRPKQTPQGWWGLQMAPTAAPTQGMPEGLFKTNRLCPQSRSLLSLSFLLCCLCLPFLKS